MKVAVTISILLALTGPASAQEPNSEHETMHESGSPTAEEVSATVQDLVQTYDRLFAELMTELRADPDLVCPGSVAFPEQFENDAEVAMWFARTRREGNPYYAETVRLMLSNMRARLRHLEDALEHLHDPPAAPRESREFGPI
ncbi:MAG: hypothetical protein A3C90_00710 [Candidatus Magasanikbacteria bacterium RIFCSPHIGHO2_02_FULL_51_14]|uniref:Uncharacterized protein n=1 Tax=Candidatus Magasanikbacteria bacterium RIFCSPHIGHO2_02_FULL_51_14 TaxID=1798683 RepID=A0A1F6MER3_9BACT|nr:MAG: hypothetical protein A3C90_00710 [Candidatus Magasanikbacteria bacterium RIFCSPHIGHO2_02_FULL_51_14]